MGPVESFGMYYKRGKHTTTEINQCRLAEPVAKFGCETELLKSKLHYAESYRLFSAASARRALFFLNSSSLGDDTL